ncbi:SMC-Scp complex subunit ScpB [Caldicellulosiruptor morganii]|uniref:SMC-Scp complex subunit ScpB n=1 Tax=Caldicellulosiruptor morganii TaxID=1387555 RepID=A0ABY7BSZ1_9FIRM|nr:SMC-Scp complex subunit ScpB [Caldicellulosiruptor morganii]WAM34411.1 SMC-Scp complex subunit ScpB [Caldicellulosiruptor morganii]
MDRAAAKSVIESILLMSTSPLEINRLAKILNISEEEVENFIEELKQEYIEAKKGFLIVKEEKGYVLVTNPENSKYIKEYFEFEQKQMALSQAAYEVLSIVALNGPVTRQEIEKIRGVGSENVIKNLLEKGLIKEAGRLETVGRPALYEVTELFYHCLGIKDLEELKQKFIEAQKGDTTI